jgi:integrase
VRHQQLLDQYITYVGLNCTPATQGCYLEKLRPLLKAWEHLAPTDFTRAEFETFLAAGKQRGWKPRTQGLYIDVSCMFIKWATERELGIPDFAKGLRKPAVHHGAVVYYAPEEMTALLEAAGNSYLAVTVALAGWGSCRRAECWRADWRDINWDSNYITIHGNKVHEDRQVMMSPTLRKVLRSRWRGQKQGRIIGDYSWTSWKSNLRRDLVKLCRKANVEYRSHHALRRSFATHLLTRGASISDVAALGGWRSVRVMARYLGTSDERMQNAVNLLG